MIYSFYTAQRFFMDFIWILKTLFFQTSFQSAMCALGELQETFSIQHCHPYLKAIDRYAHNDDILLVQLTPCFCSRYPGILNNAATWPCQEMRKRNSLVLDTLEQVKIAESFAKIGVPKIQTHHNSLAGYLKSK